MDNEAKAELQEQVAAFRAVDETVKTTGWQKSILPEILRIREINLNKLLIAKELAEFFEAQQVVNTVDALIGRIDDIIAEGREAAEVLSKEKD